MMTDKEVKRMDDLCANLGEHWKDYIVLLRADSGHVSWRASDPTWAEGACRQYTNYVNTGKQMEIVDEFNRRNG